MASRGRVPNNTTSISLHERFSKLRTAAGGKKLSGKLQEARVFATQLQKASRQNSRVTQQMERRNAALNAALKIKKKSIKQRLGVTNKTALTVGSKARVNVALKQKKLALAKSPAKANVRSAKKQITAPATTKPVRGRGAGRILSQTFTRGGSQTPQKANRGRGNKQLVANTSNRGQMKSPRGRGRGVGRGGQVQRGSPHKVTRNQNQPGRGQQPSARGQTNQRGRGQQGRGRGRGQRGRGGRGGQSSQGKVSREDLDKQLDQYMSKTRHALDQDLEKYMSNIGDAEMS